MVSLGHFFNLCTKDLTEKSIALIMLLPSMAMGIVFPVARTACHLFFYLWIEHDQRKLKKRLPYMLSANVELLLGASNQVTSSASPSN